MKWLIRWIERRRMARLVPWGDIYAVLAACSPRMVDHRCDFCGAKEELTSPTYTNHSPTCEPANRWRRVHKLLTGRAR